MDPYDIVKQALLAHIAGMEATKYGFDYESHEAESAQQLLTLLAGEKASDTSFYSTSDTDRGYLNRLFTKNLQPGTAGSASATSPRR